MENKVEWGNMLAEVALLLVNLMLLGLLLYGILQPKAARRAVKDVLKEPENG